MSARAMLLAAAGGAAEKVYVEDVFSTYLYTGNSDAQTVTNGIDLADKGGAIWIKARNTGTDTWVFDTVNGANKHLVANAASPVGSATSVTEYRPTGFSLSTAGGLTLNTYGATYASWTFRRAPRFFDVVTWTGDGTANRAIPHALGVAPGFIATKSTSAAGDWNCYHVGAAGDLKLNTDEAQTSGRTAVPAAGVSTFRVSGAANLSGVTYVAYLFAHDPSPDGVIQCGSFTTDASGRAAVQLGWEPQFVIVKGTGVGNWIMGDVSRGMSATGFEELHANTAEAGVWVSSPVFPPSASGFAVPPATLVNSSTFTYVAIRRGPMRAPTDGTTVYQATTVGPNLGALSLFPFDLLITQDRANYSSGVAGATQHEFMDRLRGAGSTFVPETPGGVRRRLVPSEAAAECGAYYASQFNNGYTARANTFERVFHAFRRAPSFFDIVCYTGTASALMQRHSLGVAPELAIGKGRSVSSNWYVYAPVLGASAEILLNSQGAPYGYGSFSQPTATTLTVPAASPLNQNTEFYVAYLFASCPGVSKVGTYTGNDTWQTIDCGFAAGARFVLIKRTDAAGDWYLWDTARGIVAGNDPHLSLNTTAAEVASDDSIDPAPAGFNVVQRAATNINVAGASYLYLAIA